MNILVVCHYGLYQDLSCSFVHAQVREYVRLGHRVRVLVPIPYGKRDWDGSRVSASPRRADGVELLPLRYLTLSKYGEGGFNTRSAVLALRPRLSALLRDFQPGVIQAHTLGFDSQVGAWLKEHLGCPLVVTTHGSDTSIPVEQGRAGELKPFCDHADRVVAVSSALADKLRTCGTKTPISVVLNGFQPRFLSGDTPKVPLSFIQVGNLLEQKRFHVTIRAFAAIRKQYPEAYLTIIGQGPAREALEALCRELGVEDSIRFLGQVPNEAVLAEMAKAQFFCMPSVREGFGIVYLEAMANGCVTIGTAGEGIADLIVSGKNGFLVPPDDPDAIASVINWCLQNPEQMETIARQGRKDVQGLTWENNAAQYIHLFNELI